MKPELPFFPRRQASRLPRKTADTPLAFLLQESYLASKDSV